MPTLNSTLTTLRQGLSDYLGDTYRYTTSGAGNGGGTTVVDATNLVVFANDFFNAWWIMLTSGTYSGQVQRVNDFVKSTGTITTESAFGGQVAGSVTYELMRFHPTSDLTWALNQALQTAFPYLKKRIVNDDLVTGNAIQNGSFEDYSGTLPVMWLAGSGTVTSYAAIKRRGARSISVQNGKAQHQATTWPGLLDLGGQTVWYEAWCYSGIANTGRLGVSDAGGAVQYSNYQTAGAKWELLRKQVTISDTPSTLRFELYADTDNLALFDGARVLSSYVTTYALPLDFQSALPSDVLIQTAGLPVGNEQPCDDIGETIPFQSWPFVKYDSDNKLGLWLLRFTKLPATGYRIRLVGDEYISALSAETDTAPLNAPEAKLLYPLAAFHLYDRLANASTGNAAVEYKLSADRHLALYERLKKQRLTFRRGVVNYGRWQ